MVRQSSFLDPHRLSRGATLIEVLVAVLVLSIGLLGLAMLQLEGIKYNTDAYLRTQATILAYDIIDRMRANGASAATGSYATAGAVGGEYCGDSAAGCADSTELRNYDLTAWYEKANEVLPLDATSGVPTITFAADIYTITISWKEREITKQRRWDVAI